MPQSRRRGEAGFSLTEMLVVLVIMGLVLGLVAPQVLRYLGSSKVKTAEPQMDNLKSALTLYFIEQGDYPSADEGLNALGPYLMDGEIPDDPWGRPFAYKRLTDGPRAYQLSSLGADGAPGGEGENADIVR